MPNLLLEWDAPVMSETSHAAAALVVFADIMTRRTRGTDAPENLRVNTVTAALQATITQASILLPDITDDELEAALAITLGWRIAMLAGREAHARLDAFFRRALWASEAAARTAEIGMETKGNA